MEELLKEFIEWYITNADDIFEIQDDPDGVIKRYMEDYNLQLTIQQKTDVQENK